MPDIIHTPLWQLPLLILMPLGCIAAVVIYLRRLAHRKQIPRGEDPDWSVPSLGDDTDATLLHRWDVRAKIVTLLVYSFAVASLEHLTPSLFAIILSLAAMAIARVSVARVLLRLLALSGFLGMLLVVLPFTVPMHSGDTVLLFGEIQWLSFNVRGLLLAVTIAAKAVAIALLMEPLLGTAPLPVTLNGLARLGLPEMAGQMVLLSYRYVHVFLHEARRMAGGMRARGFRKRTDLHTLQTIAGFLGMLFVRSFERTERVYDAMRARGYTGRFPEQGEFRLQGRDMLLASAWILAGGALIAYDRIIL
ncbi:MAG: cobalt ECF transporter T component CbiQ [Deltaproteobacteria bacterium]|nr:cobalt ECF transporter T component CbiQ [Deltaproteobacteria bacterium]